MKKFLCFHCHTVQETLIPVGRRDECSCGTDIHCCKNCEHYDETAYNQCREPQAERVLEKERSNLCDWFSLQNGELSASSANTGDEKAKRLKELDDLFK